MCGLTPELGWSSVFCLVTDIILAIKVPSSSEIAEHWAAVWEEDARALNPSRFTMNSPDIPLDIQLLVHTLCMWRQAAQAGARIVHPTSYLEPVQRAGGRGS